MLYLTVRSVLIMLVILPSFRHSYGMGAQRFQLTVPLRPSDASARKVFTASRGGGIGGALMWVMFFFHFVSFSHFDLIFFFKNMWFFYTDGGAVVSEVQG